jgi:dTDP-4-dehydrorhamnose 3,5-epimerase
MRIDKELLDTTSESFKGYLESLGYKNERTVPITNHRIPKREGKSDEKYQLKWLVDPRGSLIEVWRNSWGYCSTNSPVSQAYISVTNPGVVKGWHCHLKQTDRFFCVRGKVMLVTFDAREAFFSDKLDFDYQITIMDSEKNPETIIIPPGVVHGWKALGQEDSWVLNLVSHEYDGTDEWRCDPHSHAFNWNRRFDG